jgi:phosphate starvation-inducible protein PhoH and related proteins
VAKRKLPEPEAPKPKIPLRCDLSKIAPLTANQAEVFRAWSENKHLLLTGSAGTGKTFLSLYLLLREYENQHYHNIIILRSIVPTRDIGYLPGSLEEKIQAYMEPYAAIFGELYQRSDAWQIWLKKGVIDFHSTSFLRGLTFRRALILVDEAQNCSFHELDSIITRMGEDSRIIFCGDQAQSDFYRDTDKKGFPQFSQILQELDEFSTINFTQEDIVRSGLVRHYLLQKEKIQY